MRTSRQNSRHGVTPLRGLDAVAIGDAIQAAVSAEDAWDRVSSQLAGHGLQRTALHADLPLEAANPFLDGVGGRRLGHVWDAKHDRRLRRYRGDIRKTRDRDLGHIRPTLMFLGSSRTPLWIEHRRVLDRAAPTGFADLCRYMVEEVGQHQALALPLSDPETGRISTLSVWGDEDRQELPQFVQANRDALHMVGLYFYGMMRAKWKDAEDKDGESRDTVPLSDRERQVLELLARGAQVALIADEMAISERTVHEYVARARRKLGAASRSEAIALAVLTGSINP